MYTCPPDATRPNPFFPSTTHVRSSSSQPLTLLRFCNRVKRRRKADLLLMRPVIPLLRGRVGPEQRSMGLTIGRWVILPAATRSSALSETRRSEEHTSELQSLMRISYAVISLKQKQTNTLSI